SGGAGGFSYEWSNGETTEDVVGLPAGTYTVTITDANDCEKVVTFTVDNTVGIEETEAFDAFNIYPNPARDQFVVEFTTSGSGDVTIEVFDLAGRAMYASEAIKGAAVRHEIKTDNWPQGQYIIRITNDGESLYRKVDIIR